jgi:hypothetical protein
MTLRISDNYLSEVPTLPIFIQNVDLSNNHISIIEDLSIPYSVTYLNISDNYIEDIPYQIQSRTGLNLITKNKDDTDNFYHDVFDMPNNKPTNYNYNYNYNSNNYNSNNYNYRNNLRNYPNNNYNRSSNNYFNTTIKDYFSNSPEENIFIKTSKSKVNNANYISYANSKIVVI